MDDTFTSRNMLKKLNRKIKKSQHHFEKQTGVKCTQIENKILAVCNAGLVNGLSEEIIYEHFGKYGPLERIVMVPGISCAFVSFHTVKSAVSAYENINGKLNIAQDNKPLYLSYCENMPNNKLTHYHTGELPPGLRIIENIISEDEELQLLSLLDFNKTSSSNLKHRQVKHYGFKFCYDINNVDKINPLVGKIPRECNLLWKRLKDKYNLNLGEFDQLTVNCYKPGQGIPSHIDTHSAFEDPILSLSLGSSIVMDFRKDDGSHVPVYLSQRSLLIISGESRYSWAHGITPRKIDIVPSDKGLTILQRETRISFTFRKVLFTACRCIYKNNCDSQLNKVNEEVFEAAKLEQIHVHDVYQNIANHFSDTRHKPWPAVLQFVNSLETGAIIVDVGCGNGKYLKHNRNIFEIGCDSSSSLLDICKSKGLQVFTCNCLYIPLKNNIADGIISIAVIHHLANEERRLQAIKEIIRVLKVNGQALIYVWAKNQNKDNQKSSYLKQDRKNRKDVNADHVNSENTELNEDVLLPVHRNRTQFQHQDLLVPWKLKGENSSDKKTEFLRFYHVFIENELENLCKKCNNIDIINSYYDQGNWCILINKTAEDL